MDAEDRVRQHYSRPDLEAVALGALAAAGVDVDALTVDDLSGLDQLHAGGVAATEHVLGLLDLGPSTPLLDVGSGVGGPARHAAARAGCPVTGLDLSPDFCALARGLTARVGLDHLVTFDVGSATAMPYADGAFARVLLDHVGMNIADKPAVFAEVHRVLAPGGLFAVYDQMRIGAGDLAYPLPWAEDATSSFVETRERYAEMLAGAGFEVVVDEDRTGAAASGGLPAHGLGPGTLFGPEFEERITNNILAAMAGTLGAVVMVARRPET